MHVSLILSHVDCDAVAIVGFRFFLFPVATFFYAVPAIAAVAIAAYFEYDNR